MAKSIFVKGEEEEFELTYKVWTGKKVQIAQTWLNSKNALEVESR